tara:strand:- start:1159 stop:1428 length:270 start_codon:yes stop_codon:yes gene_type:complete
MKTATVVVVILMVGLAFTVYQMFRAEQIEDTVIKPKRGRPKGSKNKTQSIKFNSDGSGKIHVVNYPPTVKRGPGRPKGSKNKSKLKTNV